MAGDGLHSSQVAAGESVGPGEAGHAGAVEDVAAIHDQEVADPLGLVRLGLTGLPTLTISLEPLPLDREARLVECLEPVSGLGRLAVLRAPGGQPRSGPVVRRLRRWTITSSTTTAGMGSVREAMPGVFDGPSEVMLPYCLTARSTLTVGNSPSRLKSWRWSARTSPERIVMSLP